MVCSDNRRRRALLRLAAAGISAVGTLAALAYDTSPPAYLQWFEGSYSTIEQRMPDVFAAGYGFVYTPPPGRADSGNQSVGYDQYDRFDLGQPGPGNGTLYGTETGIRAAISMTHRAGLDYYVDLVWNHDGYSDLGTPGFYDAGGYPGLNITLPNAVDGDFHSGYATGDLDGRISGLIDIDQSTNFQMIRSPVPGYANNIRSGTIPAYGRLANVPDENNRRFYPDRNMQPIYVYDPKTGEQNIAIYPFNNAAPLSGDPVPENALGYLMRNAQWLVQSVGVDGFRLDAAKHYPDWVLNYFDRAVYRSSFRTNLDGTQKNVFAFSEVFDGSKSYLQTFVRKDINPAQPGVIGGNRDVLDFPLFFALHDNLSGNGLQNDWHNIQTASIDTQDDGLRNGSEGVKFVSSHDSFGPDLSNVAYAYTLLTPGNALVYFNGHEFGSGRDFPKDGRGDALGGQYGDAITTLVDLRNRYGRGNFIERWIEKENYAFERQGSAVVLLSNRTDAGYDSRTIQTSFAPGTRLVELTGNASNAATDPSDDIPDMVVVNGDGTINVRFLRNVAPGTSNFTGDGYLVYGLATPQGSLGFTDVAATIAAQMPTPDTNGTARISSMRVITSDSFTLSLNTTAVNLLGNPAFREHEADGDNALVKLDDGVDVNGNGHVDYTATGSVSYGFEEFSTTHAPGYFSADGNGAYAQAIDTTGLAEGMHFITVRAFRHRADGGPPVFTDWRQTIYVDRLPPDSTIQSVSQPGADGSERDVIARSVDQTANSVHIFLDVPAGVSDATIRSWVGQNNDMGYWDRDAYTYRFSGLTNGNHVFTLVSYEITGNVNVQRFAGQLIDNSPDGAGLGDLNFDKVYTTDDINAFDSALYSNDTIFNPAGDLDADGRVSENDLLLLGPRLNVVGAPAGTLAQYHNLLINNPADRPRTFATLLNNASGAALTKYAPGDLVIAGPQVHGPGASLTLSGGHTTLATDAGSDGAANLTLVVNSGAALTLDATEHLKLLAVNSALASVTPGHDKTLLLGGLYLSGTGKLDLADNDLVQQYTGASPYEQYRQWILDGQAGQRGILSTTDALAFPTTFAPIDNTRIHALLWNGQAISDGGSFDQLILMYTYVGDANLDGIVSEADIINILANMGHTGSCLDGDVNLDGVVSLSDYALVTQYLGAGTGGPLFGEPLKSLGQHTVPEPGTLIGLTAVLLLIRRTRRPGG